MNTSDLQKLNDAVEFLMEQPSFPEAVEKLNVELHHSREPFVWSVIDVNSIDADLPDNIKSCWIFVLKQDVPSGCHFHPNSIQHMIAVKGHGTSKVGGTHKRIIPIGSSNASLSETWFVIGENVPHEFFPEDEDMVVVSFHTCVADELEEIACGSGEKRRYEPETEHG
jgi:hypothetical protein